MTKKYLFIKLTLLCGLFAAQAPFDCYGSGKITDEDLEGKLGLKRIKRNTESSADRIHKKKKKAHRLYSSPELSKEQRFIEYLEVEIFPSIRVNKKFQKDVRTALLKVIAKSAENHSQENEFDMLNIVINKLGFSFLAFRSGDDLTVGGNNQESQTPNDQKKELEAFQAKFNKSILPKILAQENFSIELNEKFHSIVKEYADQELKKQKYQEYQVYKDTHLLRSIRSQFEIEFEIEKVGKKRRKRKYQSAERLTLSGNKEWNLYEKYIMCGIEHFQDHEEPWQFQYSEYTERKTFRTQKKLFKYIKVNYLEERTLKAIHQKYNNIKNHELFKTSTLKEIESIKKEMNEQIN